VSMNELTIPSPRPEGRGYRAFKPPEGGSRRIPSRLNGLLSGVGYSFRGGRKRAGLVCLLIVLVSGRPVAAQVFDFPPAMPLELHQPLDDAARRLQRNAMMFENRGESEKALQAYLQLFNRYPEYDPFYDGVLRNYIALERFEPAMVFADSLRQALLKKGPVQSLTLTEVERLASLIVDGGRLSGRLGRREDAFKRWNDLYNLPQPSPNAFFKLFSAMIECRFPDGLEEMTRRARKVTGDPTLLAASLASYWAEHGQVDHAVNELLLLLELQPLQADNIQRQILAFSDNEASRQQVEASLKAARSRSALRLQVAEILGAFYFRNREWEKAYEEVRTADQLGGGSGEAMLNFAETLSSESQSSLAIRVLDDMSRTHPDMAASPRVLLARGKALESSQLYIPADSVYDLLTSRPLLRTAQEQEALLLQAKLKLNRLREPAAARELLMAGMQRNPRLRSRGEITLLIGDSYLTQRNLDQARETYMQAAPAQTGSSPDIRSKALVNAAQVDLYQGQFSQASQRLDEASRSNPEGALTNDALDMLELLRSACQDSTGLASFCRAELEMRLGQRENAEAMYAAIAAETRSGELAQRALWKLAISCRSTGRPQEAINRLEELLKRFPQSLRACEFLFEIGQIRELDLADRKGAVEIYEKILVDYPNSLPAQEARRRIRNLENVQT